MMKAFFSRTLLALVAVIGLAANAQTETPIAATMVQP